MKKITDDDRKAIHNCLEFMVKEIDKRIEDVANNPNKETIDFLDKDMHAYNLTIKLAHQMGINTDQYKIDSK